ncbi:N-acetyltransferase [Candidatus Woesearchaeota archaeon]|nr:N-acetyltransferase [Candidatus Woesearchaeota archaeon]
MDILIDTHYRGYKSGVYSLTEILRHFISLGVTVEECREAGYDESFLSLLQPRRVPLSLKPKIIKPVSFSVRPADALDKDDLASLAERFLLELNGTTTKDDLSDVSALLLFQQGHTSPSGALWHEVLGNDTRELYIRALYTEPCVRKFGGGRALVGHVLEETAPSGGFQSVSLDAPENVTGFYKKLGFRGRCGENTDGMFTFQKKVEY